MILNQISYLDCLAFLVFLAPQLLIHVGILELAKCIFQALPFFCKNPTLSPPQIPNIQTNLLTSLTQSQDSPFNSSGNVTTPPTRPRPPSSNTQVPSKTS